MDAPRPRRCGRPIVRRHTRCSVLARARPPDFATLRPWFADTDKNVQLMVCLDRPIPNTMLPASIDLPALSTRQSDLPRIIDEYAQDAIAALGAPATSFGPGDHHWVLSRAARSLPEIEKATLRRVALRSSKNLSHAATRLAMAPVSLSRWMSGRLSPTHAR